MTAEAVLRSSPVAEGSGIVRLQPDCLVVVRDGFRMTAEVVLRNTPVAVGFGQVRLQSDCLVVVRDGFFMPTEVTLGIALVAVGFGIVRLQPECLAEVREGFLMTTEVSLGITPVVVGFGQVRLHPGCLIVGVYYYFKGIFFMLLVKIADGKPSLSREFLVGCFRDNGDRAPLFYGFFDVPTLLKKDGGGNSVVNRGCGWAFLDTLRSPASFARFVMDCFCC